MWCGGFAVVDVAAGADAAGWSESGRRPWESALLDIGLAATGQLGEEKGEEQTGHDVLGPGWKCVLHVVWRGGAKGSAGAGRDEGQQGNAVGWQEGREVTMLAPGRSY